MPDDTSTASSSADSERSDDDQPTAPAVVGVFSVSAAASWVHVVGVGRAISLGRASSPELERDRLVSRKHASIAYRDGRWTVEDLGSSHGTFVDGARVDQRIDVDTARPHVLRLGRTILILEPNAARFGRAKMEVGEVVVGPAMRAVFHRIERVAHAQRDLLITGETGTGKEVAAKHFHAHGPRAQFPFVSVNCSSLETLADAHLFGTVKGAFSGSVRDTKGHVRAAARGVLFLDELGDLPATTQSKLLRLLQSREVQPVGADRPEIVDVQIVAATNRDLANAALFREDLLERFYNQGHVHLPPLDRRLEEIPFLIEFALRAHATRAGQKPLEVSDAVVEACLLQGWRGNVRGLVGTIERAAVDAHAEGSDRLRMRHLQDALKRQADWIREEAIARGARAPETQTPAPAPAPPPQSAASLAAERRRAAEAREEQELMVAYERAGFNAAQLARDLNVSRSTITRRLAKMGISVKGRG